MSGSKVESASNNLVNTAKGLITWLFEPESFAPVAKIVDDKKYSIVTDYLGTPVAMVDQGGRKVWSADISVYGELRNLDGEREDCPFRWPGQYEDVETGLYYNQFRYYNPNLGVYISQDPIGLNGGLSVYAYVFDPLYWTDPFGLAKKKGCGGAGSERWKNKKTKDGQPYKKPGPKTDPEAPHNKKIQEIIDQEKAKGKIHIGGGSGSGNKTEITIPTDGGAKLAKIIAVLGRTTRLNRYPNACVGDMVVVSIKKGNPDLRRKILKAVIVRQKQTILLLL